MQRILTILKTINFDRITLTASMIASFGFFATLIFMYIGTYNPGLKYLTLIVLFLLSIIFTLTIITLIYRVSLSWKLIPTIFMILFLTALTIICIESIWTIIQFGWIKCDTCP